MLRKCDILYVVLFISVYEKVVYSEKFIVSMLERTYWDSVAQKANIVIGNLSKTRMGSISC